MSSSLSLPRSNAKTSWSWTIFRHTKFRAPRRAGDVAQPCGGEIERGLTVRERAHDTRAPPDLAQDALERVVGAKSAVSAPPGRRSSDLPHLGRTWDYSWADSVVGIRMTEPFFFIKHPSAARTFRRR